MPTKRKTPPKKKKLSLSARLRAHAGQKKTKPIPAAKVRPKPKLRPPAPPKIAHANPDLLRKHDANPIIEPRPTNYWEMKATFNPAAVYADKRVHLLYRAIGGDDVSVLGYAASDDGVFVTERLPDPAYQPIVRKPSDEKKPEPTPSVEALLYSSGGGWNGGCEDPRLILLENRIYLMYTAFDGWGSIRIALSSIGMDDFLARRWRWKDPMLLSPPGEVHKNWILFPEKINGKFAILHSISPEILIEYVDDLDKFENDAEFITSRYSRVSGLTSWDSWIRGAGPPPIRTAEGWLLFYHAMDVRDPNRYKLGAMILDMNDPTRVLYRSKSPILEPEEWYENTGWKSGVVYSCGAVVKDGELYVYYGGADSVVCVAMAKLDEFVAHLKKDGVAKLMPEPNTKKTSIV